MLQKLKTLRLLSLVIPALLLAALVPAPLQARELIKADPGKCPDGYIELSVGIGSGGENCVHKGSVVQKVPISDPNHPETIEKTGNKCPDGYQGVGKDANGKEKCAPDNKGVCPDPDAQESINEDECVIKGGGTANNPIFVYLRAIVRFVSAGVGLLLLLVLIYGGIRFTTAGGNPQAVAAAVKLILSAVIGIILFVLLVAILNFLIPGNLFG